MKRLLLLISLFNSVISMSQSEINWAGNFPIGFEQSYESEYYLIDTSEVWQVCHPQKQILFIPNNEPHLGHSAILTDSTGFYSENVKSSVQILLYFGPDVESYWILFEHKYDFEKSVDGGIIETSYDNGVSWKNILFDTLIQNNIIRSENFYTVNDEIESLNGEPGFTGIQDTMKLVFLEFKSRNWMIEKSVLIRFMISTDSHDNFNEGWMIDDIRIGGVFVGVKEAHLNHLTTFPNPVQNVLNMNINPITIKSIEILNSYGELINKFSGNLSNQISVSDYLPGIYFLVLINQSDEKYISKFIKL